MEVKKEQFLTKCQHFLRKSKFESEIDYIGSRSILNHKGVMVWQQELISCKSLDSLNYEKGATLVNGVKEHYWVKNEYAIFYSMFLSNIWVHENCVRDRMLKKALWKTQNHISHGNTILHMHNHSNFKLHSEGLVIFMPRSNTNHVWET